MKRFRCLMAAWIVLIGFLAACQPVSGPPQSPVAASPGAPPVVTATSPPSPRPVNPTMQAVSTPSATVEQEDTPVTPTLASLPGGQQKMVGLAVDLLAKQVGIPAGEISLVGIEPVVWRDASLGCPKPAIDYLRVETPGFRIQLRAGEQVYTLHSDETRRVVRCE